MVFADVPCREFPLNQPNEQSQLIEHAHDCLAEIYHGLGDRSAHSSHVVGMQPVVLQA